MNRFLLTSFYLLLLLLPHFAWANEQVPAKPAGNGSPSAEITRVEETAQVEAAETSNNETQIATEQTEDIEDFDLGELLSKEIRVGEMGSFGQRLSEYGVTAEIHGYISAEFKGVNLPWLTDGHELSASNEAPFTFDLHHQVLNLRADIFDRVTPELQLEWEHAGKEFYVPLAQIDIEVVEELIVRAGYFPVPVGAFNEYQYPDFLRKTAQQPLFSREVIPSLWSEVGVQLRGKIEWAGDRNVNYALFVSNGLEQVEGEGGSIRGMRKNDRDKSHPDKAFGGRLGVSPIDGLNIGVSGYTGAYTTDGVRQLSILDLDFSYRISDFLVRFETAIAFQEIAGGTLQKDGSYLLVAYKVLPFLEPYFWVETVDLDQTPKDRNFGILFGTAFYPFPDYASNVILKLEANTVRNANAELAGQGMLQLVVGF